MSSADPNIIQIGHCEERLPEQESSDFVNDESRCLAHKDKYPNNDT